MKCLSIIVPWRARFTPALAAVAVCGAMVACSPRTPSSSSNAGTTSGGGGQTTDENVLINDALGFEGSLSGKVADSQSTRSASESQSAQDLPPDIDTDNTCVRFRDLAGNPLLGENGVPIVEVPLGDDGTFSAEGLPVGTDFTVCVDIGKDDDCNIESCVHIPSDDGGPRGTLSGVQADPLTTLILAKLRRLLDSRGISPRDLPVSPVAIVTRIVSAYHNLFDDAGIDHTVSLEDISALLRDALADFFDEQIPAAVRVGMNIVKGNLQAARAEDAEALALAVAEVFLRAGFPVADLPTAPDLSALAGLDGVSIVSQRELFGDSSFEDEADLLAGLEDEFPPELLDLLLNGGTIEDVPEEFRDQIPEEFLTDFPDGLADALIDDPAAQQVPGEILPDDVTVFISDFVEPDRNFIAGGEGIFADAAPDRPVISDRVLVEMARLHLQGRMITLGALYDLLTDLNTGLGLRLTYFFHDPGFAGEPLTIFETADGRGLAINLESLFLRLFSEGLDDLDPESFERREAEIRSILIELLGDTLPPALARLFGGFSAERVAGAEELARRIRDARAHLPFSRSGPSSFFVVADGDMFDPESVNPTPGNPVTVGATVAADGSIGAITYNDQGEGEFFLGFTRGTDDRGIVELIVRETGRRLHGPRGPLRASVFDGTIFRAVGGQPFSALVSASGARYPIIHIAVIREDFVLDGDSSTTDSVTVREELIAVLASADGDKAAPVRVDYDPTTQTATFNPFGRFLLMLLADSHQTGEFALFNEAAGKPALIDDPERFFDRPTDLPEDFEDVFNDVDEFGAPIVSDALAQPAPLVAAWPSVQNLDNARTDRKAVFAAPSTAPPAAPPTAMFFDGGAFILVAAANIVGLEVTPSEFRHVFGTEVANPRHDPDGDPFFDDINTNGMQDDGEPTSPFLPVLFDPQDWRSTDIRLYYRRADNDGPIALADIAFDADQPRTVDGVALVARSYRPRMNAFRFGRPNTAINLLTAFLPADFFDGTHGLDRTSTVDIFSAVAIINLVMDQVFNIEAEVDVDGFGPLPRRRMLTEAHAFVVPLNDPFALLVKGFALRSEPESAPE